MATKDDFTFFNTFTNFFFLLIHVKLSNKNKNGKNIEKHLEPMLQYFINPRLNQVSHTFCIRTWQHQSILSFRASGIICSISLKMKPEVFSFSELKSSASTRTRRVVCHLLSLIPQPFSLKYSCHRMLFCPFLRTSLLEFWLFNKLRSSFCRKFRFEIFLDR